MRDFCRRDARQRGADLLPARTGKLDNGDEQPKSLASLRVVGLKRGGTAMVRWSDDDYATNSRCRAVDLGAENARCVGAGRFAGEALS